MRAMTYRGPYRVRYDVKPDPVLEHPDDIIVRVNRAAICGSDLHLYHGLVPDTRIGHTFGHEFTGTVEETGSDVQSLKKGDKVLIPFNIACGVCYWCSRELYSNCHNTNPNSTVCCGIYGYSHSTGGYDGGQAEFVRVPLADFNAIKVPNEIHEEDALLLTDVFPTGYQAAEMGEIKRGDTVVIFGAGPVGIFAAKSAWLLGAGRVIVFDEYEYRLDFIKKFAKAETYNFAEIEDPVWFIKKITDWLGADVCIDAVGAEAHGSEFQRVTGVRMKLQAGAATALFWAINSVRKNGVVSVVGVYGPTMNMVPMGSAMNKGLTIRMAQCHVKRYIPRLMEHILQGRVSPKEIITHRVPLEEVSEAYHRFSSKNDQCIKTILIPPHGETLH